MCWDGMRRLKRGILKFALLKLLSETPRHGYDLIREIREKGWAGGAGSVYPLLLGSRRPVSSPAATRRVAASTNSRRKDEK